MAYINTDTLKYPVFETEIRGEYPNTSFANPFTPPEVYQYVFPAPAPTYNPEVEYYREIAPALTAKGNYEQRWEVFPLPAEQIQANQQAKALRVLEECVASAQQRLDDFAKTRNYDGILSACTYATSTVAKFQSEGQYCVDARDATWSKLYQIMDEVAIGARIKPSGFADIESELPELVWPQ